MIEHNRAISICLAASAATFALAACTSMMRQRVSPTPAISLEQNWSFDERRKWYLGSQGSRLLPERWLRALEALESQHLFLDPAHMRQFNYIDSTYLGSDLPLGFAIDVQDDSRLHRTKLRWFDKQSSSEPWVGLNCAACHTAQIEYEDQPKDEAKAKDKRKLKVLLVDGAPGMGDFQRLVAAINAAVEATIADPVRWDRFAQKVLAPMGKSDPSRDTPANREKLAAAVKSWLEYDNALERLNHLETPLDYGYGRLDAVGHILNKTAYLTGDGTQTGGPPDAPVSYPFIWNAPQHDYLQWNGIVQNTPLPGPNGSFDIGALVRNTSEVIGVFADVRVVDEPGLGGLNGYPSSVNVDNLVAMENQLASLMSPAWSHDLPGIDWDKAGRGRTTFVKDCKICHEDLARTDTKSRITAVMSPLYSLQPFTPGDPVTRETPVGTDPWMACNAYTYKANGGVLTGDPIRVLGLLSKEPDPDKPGQTKTRYLLKREFTSNYLQNEAVGVLLARKWSLVGNALRSWGGFPPTIDIPDRFPLTADGQMEKAERLKICKAHSEVPPSPTAKRLLAYKARPLNGIWATAPYLHNGSVPNLYELLLDPQQRSPSFSVGSRLFDPERVGFVAAPGQMGQTFDTRAEGNSNAGHFYKVYSPAERWELVEYLKTL
jgi:hypothetical protein